MTNALRTPDSRFAQLADYPFAPHYIDNLPGYEGLRGHYLDEGDPSSKEIFLCLHGEPSWSYLYRKMIPILTQAGVRVIAPDLLGFGKSDKPRDEATYSFDFHRNYLMGLIEALDLNNITLVCQDWGGVLGLTIPHAMQKRFSRLLIMNTALMTGSVNQAFIEWKAYLESEHDAPVGEVMRQHAPGILPQEIAAYEAPFPDASYKAGVRKFPSLVATTPDFPGVATSLEALEFWGNQWNRPTFMAVGMLDDMLGPETMGHMREAINGFPAPLEIPTAGHFLQEQVEIIAHKALEHFGLLNK